MERLVGSPQHYAWGSTTMIPQLLGETQPADQPLAELWFGAHPANPSRVETTTGTLSLLTRIEADPDAQLGSGIDRLPFLVKILAAANPLSLQAHPSKQQAEVGFAAENASGIPVDSPQRNFRDDNHKPELLIALTDFRALAGFRPVNEIRQLFAAFSCPELDTYALMVDGAEDESLRALFTTWISLPPAAADRLIAALLAQVERYGADHRDGAGGWIGVAGAVFTRLVADYPHDVGVLVSLLLSVIDLAPGEAMFIPAQQLHSYVHGLAVEVQANSDNVVRGGLTAKHVDVPALVNLLSFTSLPDPRVSIDAAGQFGLPTREFAVQRVDTRGTGGGRGPIAVDISAPGPRIVVCVDGAQTFTASAAAAATAAAAIELRPGAGLWSPASDGPLSATGEGISFVVTAPVS
ncbi:MAG: mannose-6-phosphate isomerase, class I [Corynebacterium sp.]|nr:mannose-6-phosphate isomerase, class I [Corynebacterium sp.]